MIDSESRVLAGSGQFRLDVDDSEAADTYTMPKLIEPDLHEILDEPVKLPVTRWVLVCNRNLLIIILHILSGTNNSDDNNDIWLCSFKGWTHVVVGRWLATISSLLRFMWMFCGTSCLALISNPVRLMWMLWICQHVMCRVCLWLWRLRPPSPAVKLLHTSTDAKSAVDLVVSQIASNDIQTSLQALHQVNHSFDG